ncbi:Methenyltetrahydromethanopterin cyclohydrolase [Candidatus Methanoperedenaceae archaeon GB50]|nr:MAG: methenyltetrahydromethanopterin cyclohydrolase [Methanosarcinales archaeon]CAD7769413.1 Methenyltetrahydromethanopterin cyclohydrolase [Candidatus Methanoperedenaceae archaeon GB37]CAD7769481.1 Methenyltetrahydromethanopterin cyclohydrolase [Candidatus Methanoperedenaceae archaeon GB50]CAD7778611.1 MAG: Methenyltetrahydromethanopterin cyclohydrolase [Candidatus Methanoperedenaceae archaeon GB50]
MLSVNEKAMEIAEEMLDWAEELKIESVKLKNDARVIDCGVNTTGSYEAGLMFTDICMGGLNTSSISVHKIGDVPLSFIDITTDHPSIACLGAQKAGWSISVDKYFAMGSGPARALALKPKNTYDRIGYTDSSECAVIALESAQLPDEKVMEFIAKECGVDVENTVALVAPTASIVGSVQVSGRVVETGVYKLNELGYDTTRIICGSGTAPIAPVVKDDTKAMGATNDSVIYYGSVNLTVRGFDEEIFKKVPSTTSADYGKPFFKTFKAAGYDFYKIDVNIFAPAEITVNDLETGKTYHSGYLNGEVILESYEITSL